VAEVSPSSNARPPISGLQAFAVEIPVLDQAPVA
jgi:hypothetical protein